MARKVVTNEPRWLPTHPHVGRVVEVFPRGRRDERTFGRIVDAHVSDDLVVAYRVSITGGEGRRHTTGEVVLQREEGGEGERVQHADTLRTAGVARGVSR